MSPQRVFRDLVMSDVEEPLRPALRDALLHAFNATAEASQAATQPWKTRPQIPANPWLQQQSVKTSMSRPPLPTPPPSPSELPSKGEVAVEHGKTGGVSATEFHFFPLLPYEIRRMVWEQALPTRVVLRNDLDQSSYRGVRHTFRPASHTHSIEVLWRSDLFYACTEARRVVEAYYDGAREGNRNTRNKKKESASEDKTAPLVRETTNSALLEAGLDVLYYPWLGSQSHHGQGGAGLWVSGRHNHDLHQQGGVSGIEGMHPLWMSASMDASQATTSRKRSMAASLAAAPINDVPYSYWASQLQILRLPVKTVALDAAWVDRGHPDVIAWAAGVDLTEQPGADGGDEEEKGGGEEKQEEKEQELPVLPPTSLQLVMIDLVVPVCIRLDDSKDTLTPDQRRLLQHHITPQSWTDARTYRRDMERLSGASLTPESFTPPSPSSSSSSSSSPSSSSSSPSVALPLLQPLINLNGMDFTVLVDLYDDGRIEEILSLQTAASEHDQQTQTTEACAVLNKSALHQCIACTRRAWEARDSNAWAAKFGPLLGAYLRKLCRPTIVFSVVLVLMQAMTARQR